MPAVLHLIEPSLLDEPPPRRLPLLFVPNLLGEYIIEQPLSVYFDPFLIGCIIAATSMALLQIGPLLWVVLLVLVAVRLATITWEVWRRAREDYRLIKYGIVVHAHVMGVRPDRDAQSGASGAYIDCVIPVLKRRTVVGSVWTPDVTEAVHLARKGRIQVICLARAPGTWRLRQLDRPNLRYEPISNGRVVEGDGLLG